MFIVTGAAGFIGSCVVSRLNKMGIKDIVLVDRLDDLCVSGDIKDKVQKSKDSKKLNINNKKFVHFYDKEYFIDLILNNKENMPNELVLDSLDKIEAIIHMGACSSTTLTDAKYYKENNLEYTKVLAQWALRNNIRFIYASSAATYGDGSLGYRDDDDTIRSCKPLNLYGRSKSDFDLWALDNNMLDKCVGLKFFNVFGPNEYHKDDMRSVVAKAYKRVVDEGVISLFKSYVSDYKDGEQKRDFIYVKDVVDVIMYFMENLGVNGVFNVGTGNARSWNDLAIALFRAVDKPVNIDYIEMPESLRDKYQYFTQADMRKLRSSGYSKDFTSLEDAVKDYSRYLDSGLFL